MLHASLHLMLSNPSYLLMTIACLMHYVETESQWKEVITYITWLLTKGKNIQSKLPGALILSWHLTCKSLIGCGGLYQQFGRQIPESHSRTESNTKKDTLYVISPVSDLV